MTNVNKRCRKHQSVAWVAGLVIAACAQTYAATTDLASAPLSTSSASVVRPNILFTLDDSGSMDWDYLPDYAGGRTYSGGSATHCKVSNTCGIGETPFQTNEYNGMIYNPRLSYQQPVNADGTLKPSQTSTSTTGWTVVKVDGYGVQSTANINLTNGYAEVVYCNGGVCKKNGVDTNNPFLLRSSVSADNPPVYAFPGTLTTGTTISSTLVPDGTWNQANTTTSTLFNGTLDISRAASSGTLSGVSVSHSGSTVTVAYTAVSPALVTGNTVVVSGGTCSSGYKSGGSNRAITVVDATHFTYTSNAGSTWTGTSCTVTYTKAAYTAVPPSIGKSGNTVTVILAAAPTPALANGNLVTVTNASGTCDAGYQTTSASMTRNSSTSFSYSVPTAVGTANNTTCYITQVTSPPPASPGISLNGTTVTVYKTTHGLVTGDLIQVSNGSSGTCDSGYRTSGSVTVTRVDANTFTYSPPVGSVTTNSNCKIDKMLPGGTTTYTSTGTVNANPYYFVMIPVEYCDSMYLTNCKAAVAPLTVSGVEYKYPAPVRYCKNDATAALPPGDAGAQKSASGTINCQAKYSVGTGINFQSARYGLFKRTDIVPAQTTYGDESYSGTVNGTGWASPLTYSGTLVVDRSKRSDCVAVPNCTYAEEMTNFANWYTYYRTRMQMMKSSAGRSFSILDNRYRVGFVTINESASKYLPIAMFDGAQKTNWYAKFYAVKPNSSTPLREAMANAGRYFAGKKPGIFTDDPMEYACQQNFELITTDGYWNGTDSNVKEIDGTTTMRNYDNVDSGASKRADGAYDGGISGASNTLADVAMYYYKTDIRNSTLSNCSGAPINGVSGDVCQDIVPRTSKDTLAGLTGTQHMTTYSLGLADGLMTYQSDYENAVTGDVSNIKTGAIGCSFSGAGTCNWPLPVSDSQTALDDLWHAAVNGRGTYYNARDPATLSAGLSGALAGINVKLSAAAASATSSPIITQSERTIFSSTYRTTIWDGEVQAKLIDPITGIVQPTVIWSAQGQLNSLIQADTSADKTSRHIYAFDEANALGNHLKDFLYASLTTTEKTYFDNKCQYVSGFFYLTQCSAGTISHLGYVEGNIGQNLVNYLRGSQALELPDSPANPRAFRARENILGDTVNSTPKYVKSPLFSFYDAVTPSYTSFKSAHSTRQGVLYMGSNDGMLHAFNADTGAEMWAYVPKIIMPNLYKLAETSYSTLHQFYVDGSPETMDIFVDATAYPASGLTTGWHTILVGALGLGGKGFFALDVTDPANPEALWEICSDSALCTTDAVTGIVHSDPDMGYSYGNPVIAKRSTDGKWVVLLTSGYNNVSATALSGQGILYELDAVTGAVLHKASTGSGSAGSPSGLAKLSPWVDSLSTDFTTRFVYGGDLNGDVWRFDLGAFGADVTPTATRIASLKDSFGNAQPVTARIELGDPLNNTINSLNGTGNPGVFVGTGRYLGTTDLSNIQIQTVYALKDNLSKIGAAAYIGNPRAPQAGFGSFVQQYIYQPTTTTRTTSQNAVNWTTDAGWYADLVARDSATNNPISPSPSPGERMRLDPHLVSGTLSVITSVPGGSACSAGGSSWKYSFDFLNGKNIPNHDVAVLLNEGAEGSVVVSVGGQIKELITMTGGETITEETPTKGSAATRRTSWRELMQ